MTYRTLWNKSTKGQAMVEAAFVLFILVLFAFGITEFGRAMYNKNTLNNAARAGARAAVVTNPLDSLPRTYNSNSAVDNIQQNIFGSLFNITKSQVTATVCVADSTGACISKTTATSGDVIKVTVQYGTAGSPGTGFQSVVPKLILIRNVLTGQASMRYE